MPIDSKRARLTPRPARDAAAVSRRELDEWCDRLRANGATDDEVNATRATWDQFDGDYTPASRAAMVRWPDHRIQGELRAVRAEYVEHTSA